MNATAERNPLVHALYLLANVNLLQDVRALGTELNLYFAHTARIATPANAGDIAAAWFRLAKRLACRSEQLRYRDPVESARFAQLTEVAVGIAVNDVARWARAYETRVTAQIEAAAELAAETTVVTVRLADGSTFESDDEAAIEYVLSNNPGSALIA